MPEFGARWRSGSYRRGSDHPRSKLDPEKVRDIRRRVAEGESQSSVARSYGVTASAVCKIINGDAWGHITDEPTVEERGGTEAKADLSALDVP